MWRKRRWKLDVAGPCPGGLGPEWSYLGGPSSSTKERAYRFGLNKEREHFIRWAKAYAGGRFFTVLQAEYQAGRDEN
jgi:hypothetical protein